MARIKWKDFNRFETRYLSLRGEGETMAAQAEAAVNKLVYRWFNDGDVFDNHYGLDSYEDVSSYANWLANHVNGASSILERIYSIDNNKNAYTAILYELCVLIFDNREFLDGLATKPKIGSIYTEQGKFSLEENFYNYEED